jgi:hypothetical protein
MRLSQLYTRWQGCRGRGLTVVASNEDERRNLHVLVAVSGWLLVGLAVIDSVRLQQCPLQSEKKQSLLLNRFISSLQNGQNDTIDRAQRLGVSSWS